MMIPVHTIRMVVDGIQSIDVSLLRSLILLRIWVSVMVLMVLGLKSQRSAHLRGRDGLRPEIYRWMSLFLRCKNCPPLGLRSYHFGTKKIQM